MKLKADFVTNSSSASFIMTLRSVDGDMDADDLKEKINDFIEYFRSQYGDRANNLRYYNGVDVERVARGLFTITEWTSMYNYPSDIPEYMQAMMLEDHLEEDENLARFGFKVEKFRIQSD
jgi:hypothetical protein